MLDAKAQSWVSIQWHNSVSHYNYYYNANELVKTAKEDVVTGYKDNFKDVITLYPMLDQSALKGNASKMDEVLKKCSFVIPTKEESHKLITQNNNTNFIISTTEKSPKH